jgi:LacI family transcriptional regulator
MRKKHPRVLLALGWYEPRLHMGIAKFALGAGWHLCADVTKEKVVPWGWEGDGILAWLGANEELTRFVVEAKLPTVDFSRRRTELPFPRVVIDDVASVRLVAEHFLVRGFRQFMYYSGQDNWAFENHGNSFVDLLKREGYDCTWIRWHKSPAYSTGHMQWSDKRRWLATELKKAPKPLAMFAATDDHALEVVEVCEAIGLSVPEQVGVVGMDNSLMAVDAMETPISSVDQNFSTLGFRGAELLNQLMRGRVVPSKPIFIPPAGLIARKSSDLLAVGHAGLARCLRYIWDNYQKPLSMDDLAKVAALSRAGLFKAFTKNLGRTPGSELHRVRMENAKRLLAKSQMKLDEIAELSGYQSANSFWIAFKQSTGMSPRQYQKQFCV